MAQVVDGHVDRQAAFFTAGLQMVPQNQFAGRARLLRTPGACAGRPCRWRGVRPGRDSRRPAIVATTPAE
jgi:hypothetical protein